MAKASTAPAAAAQPEVVPERWPDSRYEELREHSPFALATAAAPPPPPDHNFAEGLKLKGIGYSQDKDGKTITAVWVESAQSAANKVEFELDGNELGKGDGAGIFVAKINQSPEWGKTTVELKKGNEVATIEYDQMMVEAAPTPPRPGRQGIYRPPAAQAPGHPIPSPAANAGSGPRLRSGVGYSAAAARPGVAAATRPPTRVISGNR